MSQLVLRPGPVLEDRRRQLMRVPARRGVVVLPLRLTRSRMLAGASTASPRHPQDRSLESYRF
ncbi:hypothetical protein GTW98_16140 [Streptomyces sp. SID8375]|uniref:Uncharacterized protein n=2 Tax=Streptomyces nigrescens TaxID=1920 RepID=A0A640T7F1_STRNI|nr:MULTISPECIES: hypothetical protein [Streptomyces]MCX5449430.1 hypothetical protein [Streptomyces libani]MYX08313.1 hypothetical protein [Streptomyces sp. SID8375]WAT94557.1 hypothetical protein STRLI_000200 [Streptomyces libani subsp. libani]WAU02314.1 hypothetical protein STRNI_000339 [Streptomyces nigrescens]GFE19663.1 hypothetical protein Sliba_01160 [Streptomyces libani subsp. libani]